MDRLKSEVCKALVNLLQNWCQLVLYCGFFVRQCNWSGWHPGSAMDAQNVLRLVFVLLTDLGWAAADPVVYVRTIGVALLHWQVFNSGLPRLCYGEEFGEVMLSRLGSMKDRQTWALTPSNVEDLFVQICPAIIYTRPLVSGLSSDIETEIDSACTRMLLMTAQKFGTVLGSRVPRPWRGTGRLNRFFRPTLTVSRTWTH